MQAHRTHQGVGGAAQDVAGNVAATGVEPLRDRHPGARIQNEFGDYRIGLDPRGGPLALVVISRFTDREVGRLQRDAQHGPRLRIGIDQQDGLAPVEQADVHNASMGAASACIARIRSASMTKAASRLSLAAGVSASMNSNS